MKLSSVDEVVKLYDGSATDYDQMMDQEIDSPVYQELLNALVMKIQDIEGTIVDTSCGTGHMLALLRDKCGAERRVQGVDLSPAMVELAGKRLGDPSLVHAQDMSDLTFCESGSCAAVISFFAVHHVGPEVLAKCFNEWFRVLVPNGRLLLAAWEGSGAIDYGQSSDITARYYSESELVDALRAAAFRIESKSVRVVSEMNMNASYVMATRA